MGMKVVKNASQLNPLAEFIQYNGMTEENLPKYATLKPGKTFRDFLTAWNTSSGYPVSFSFEGNIAERARRLFPVIEAVNKEALPDDGF